MKSDYQFTHYFVVGSKSLTVRGFVVRVSLLAVMAVMVQGCSGLKDVNDRRVGARWNALNVAKSTQVEGKVPTDWTAGIFIRTSALETCANLVDHTEISYQGNDPL